MYTQLIQLGITILGQFLDLFTKNQAPQEVLDAISASITALQAHYDDTINKANLEVQRG